MIEFRRLTDAADARYADAIALYKESFPIHEQRLPDSQAAILKDEAYHFDLIYDDGEWMGLMLWWEAETFIYVEHFCIRPAARNRGCGGRALAHLAEKGKTVILEIDPPVDEISLRREAFYERCGYRANIHPHVHPPYRAGFPGHELVVMSRPEKLSHAQYGAFAEYLRKRVMGQ